MFIPNGLTQHNGTKYYVLEYVSYADKAISVPSAGSVNKIKPPPINGK